MTTPTSAAPDAASASFAPDLGALKPGESITLSILITPSGAATVLAKRGDTLIGSKIVRTPVVELLPPPLRALLAQIMAEEPERKHAAEVEKDIAAQATAKRTAIAKAVPDKTATASKPAAVQKAAETGSAKVLAVAKPIAKTPAVTEAKPQGSFFDTF